jgi:hypothetical protein
MAFSFYSFDFASVKKVCPEQLTPAAALRGIPLIPSGTPAAECLTEECFAPPDFQNYLARIQA